MEAEKRGKTTLTKEELLERALKAYKKYEEDLNETYTMKKVDREYTQTMIEEAEELLLIKPVENGYQLNKQVLESLKKHHFEEKSRS